ncbi:uncharacterized protein WM277_017834 [Molossus nigricans]
MACSLADPHVEGCAPRGQGGGQPGRGGGVLRGRRQAAGEGCARTPWRGCPGTSAEARRPPLRDAASRLQRSLRGPGGTAGGAARQARARSAPGLLGLAPGRGGALRGLFKGKGWSEGCRAAGRQGEPGTHAYSLLSPRDLSSRSLRPPPVLRVPQAVSGRAHVIQVLFFPLPSRYVHHSHPGGRPGPETPSSRLDRLLVTEPGAPAIARWQKRRRFISDVLSSVHAKSLATKKWQRSCLWRTCVQCKEAECANYSYTLLSSRVDNEHFLCPGLKLFKTGGRERGVRGRKRIRTCSNPETTHQEAPMKVLIAHH